MTGLWKFSPVFLWTFHQTASLDRLVGSSTSYSFDLKSAIDRWPLYFLFEVFQAFFERSFASVVVNSALAFNIFEVPFVRGKPSYVSVRCLLYTHHPYGLMAGNHRYPCRRFSTLAYVGDHYRNQHDSRVYTMYMTPLASPTLESWLGRGAKSLTFLSSKTCLRVFLCRPSEEDSFGILSLA
ncbi:hypothetical protein ACB092_06G050700, partial [Castanea dentata]